MQHRRTLTVVTPLAPDRAQHLATTARSVARTVAALRADRVDAGWTVVVDGPGGLPDVPELRASWTTVLRLPSRSGVAAARNVGLAAAPDGWVLPLDGDDELLPGAVADLLGDPALSGCGWASSNRVLGDGGRTPHWCDRPRRWLAGELAEQWRAPLWFHPNSVLVQRRVALEAGGWPALPLNEDHLFAVLLGELADGASTTHCTLRYRTWEGQLTASRAYTHERHVFHDLMVELVNARRARIGRPPVPAPQWPEPAGAHPGRTAAPLSTSSRP